MSNRGTRPITSPLVHACTFVAAIFSTKKSLGVHKTYYMITINFDKSQVYSITLYLFIVLL